MAYNYEYPGVNMNDYNNDWILKKMKELILEWKDFNNKWSGIVDDFNDLKEYVENYFNNLDISQEINSKINSMLEDGTLEKILYNIFMKRLIFVKNENNIDKLNGNCTILTFSNPIIIDLSTELNLSNILTSLHNTGLVEISYVIISHWHSDHANTHNLIALIDRGLITSNTVFFLPRKSSNSSIWTSELEDNYNYFIETLTTHNIHYTFPDNDTLITESDFTMRFVNCSISDIDFYDSISSDYNNYSMCVYVEYMNNRFGFFSDIYNIAQERIYENGLAFPCRIRSTCHHGYSNYNINFIMATLPELTVTSTCKNYLYAGNVSANTELSLLTGLGVENLYTTDEDIIFTFNSGGIYSRPYPTIVKTFHNTMTFYVDGSSETKGDGTEAKPFTSIEEALSIIYKIKFFNIILVCENITYNQRLVLNNIPAPLTIRGLISKGFYLLNSTITLENCISIVNELYPAIQISNSNCTFLNTSADCTKVTPNTLNSALNVQCSSIRGDIELKNAYYGIYSAHDNNIQLDSVTYDNVSYGLNNIDRSIVSVNSYTGTINSARTSSRSISSYGALNKPQSLESVIGNVVTFYRHVVGNSLTINLDIKNLQVESNGAIIATITGYLPDIAINFPVWADNGVAYMKLSTTGDLALFSSDYSTLTHIIGSVTYTVNTY